LAAPRPADEESRLESLYDLAILDTPADDRFDSFTDQAMERFGVPVALITLVDRDRQWFKSRPGLDYPESHRDESFCAHTILGPNVMQVPDAVLDDRFADNPVVVATRLRFYAGAPLTLGDGSRVGTLCIADRRPRLLTDLDLDALRALADQVVEALLSLRAKS
jgi:GAF domain-containing protein